MGLTLKFLNSEHTEALTDEQHQAVREGAMLYPAQDLPGNGIITLVIDGLRIVGKLLIMASGRRFTITDVRAIATDVKELVNDAREVRGTKAERQALKAARTAERKARRQAKRTR